ncbi:MAG: hypothetical protein AAGF10_00470 [Verrucomicrobiota bacterium]
MIHRTFFRFALAVLLLLGACHGLRAQAASPTPVGILRMPPLPDMPQTINAVGYALDADQWLQLLVIFSLGPMGYPSFPGASRTENTALLYFDAGEWAEPPMVVMGNFAPRSAIPQRIEEAGWTYRAYGDWYVFSPNPSDLAYVNADNLDAILELVRKERDFDFEFEVNRTQAELAAMREQYTRDSLSAYLQDSGEALTQQGLDARMQQVELAFAFLENFSSSSLGMSLDRQRLVIGTRQQALPDTPEAAFFNAPAGGETPVAERVPDTGAAALVYHVDPEAADDYMHVVLERFRLAADDEQLAQIDRLESTLEDIFSEWDGTGAFSYKLQDAQTNYIGVVGGEWTQEPFARIFDELFDTLVPEMLASLPEQDFDLSMDEAGGDGMGSQLVSSALPAALGSMLSGDAQTAEEAYSPPTHEILDGRLYLATDPVALPPLIAYSNDTPADGTTPPPSLAERITLDEGELLRSTIDLKQVALDGLEKLNLERMPTIKLSLDDIRAVDLEPVSLSLRTEDEALIGRIVIPIETVRELTQFMNKIELKQREQGIR